MAFPPSPRGFPSNPPAKIEVLVPVPWGAIINSAACLGGAGLGLALGGLIPERARQAVFQLFGLLLIPISLSMIPKDANMMMVMLCVAVGGGLGVAFKVGERIDSLAMRLKGLLRSSNPAFAEGLVASSVMVCAGAMAIVGSFEEGLGHGRTTILTKSLIDFFAVAVMASRMGSGVAWCFIPTIIYQGALTMAAAFLQPLMTPEVESCVSAAGGILVLGIGVNMLGLKPPIPISSVWPAMILAALAPLLLN
jgi:uncharacterized membrane protein YqgA involved in biofilm formation